MTNEELMALLNIANQRITELNNIITEYKALLARASETNTRYQDILKTETNVMQASKHKYEAECKRLQGTNPAITGII